MAGDRMFPVLLQSHEKVLLAAGCPRSVPWDFVARHDQQCRRNHDQTAERLAERGGLGVLEMCAVVLGKRYREVKELLLTELGALPMLQKLLEEYAAEMGAPPPVTDADHWAKRASEEFVRARDLAFTDQHAAQRHAGMLDAFREVEAHYRKAASTNG